MEAHVLGIGLGGPGLDGWPSSALILNGSVPYRSAAFTAPRATLLPATERRRAGRIVQLAVQVAQEAIEHAGVSPATVQTVFASSGGDLETVHELCLALAQTDKFVSPMRFHNSVHNAAAGYWSIATGAHTPSTSLSCYDCTFAAGLLEALCQLHAGAGSVLLVGYDYPAPDPLHSKRPLAAPFGVALLLSMGAGVSAYGKMRVTIDRSQKETSFESPELEKLRRGVPAARALPLLKALAGSVSDVITLEYLGNHSLRLEAEPCR